MVTAALPTVPALCPGGTVVCVATGPSLTVEDVDYVRGKADAVIAINDAFRLAPWAEVMYGCDAKFYYWHWEKGLKNFAGLKFSLDSEAKRYPGVQVLRNTGETGLELDPSGIRVGRNSGYQAINVAVHLGAKKVVLLGYDMQGDHYFGSHPDKSKPPFAICLERFKTLVEPMRDAGVDIVNCTPNTALTCFPCAPLRETLPALDMAEVLS
jgi:hypothetical protein